MRTLRMISMFTVVVYGYLYNIVSFIKTYVQAHEH